MTIIARTIVAAAAIGLGLSSTAFAHAHLKTTVPAAESTVSTSPAELDLGFSEGLDVAFSRAALKGADGKLVETGKAALKAGDGRTLVVPLMAPLQPGYYTVDWQALSTDGHKTTGSYGFTFKP
ncbi:hypothetical protein SAMN05216548_10265 [Faunimonas pinastri]|uniref:CopC domain-containing protein n=1 Tax=Faunimonas pinastri TaxID=1855383 RepID=A0A1H9C6J1_9HYPH|nr:copper homeostasis periplasmic binding protein CopC [Faunimonas pinastri]SEP96734.1 hypothetical protein SAMN05216548_10265 [Faunimonas pinastri]